jgi:hypothetical protein
MFFYHIYIHICILLSSIGDAGVNLVGCQCQEVSVGRTNVSVGLCPLN